MNSSNEYKQDALKKSFWKKVKVLSDNECWEWQRSLTKDGYGQFSSRVRSLFGISVRGSRAAWQLTYGEIPVGMQVLHSCDNRKCCNPRHLFLGTHKDNMRDMKLKGRQACGPKWSEQQRKEISNRMIGNKNGVKRRNSLCQA